MNENNAVKYIRNAGTEPSPRTPEHTRQLLRTIGEPTKRMKLLKVYGESGKSLLAFRLSHMLTAAGYCVGTISLDHLSTASRTSLLVNNAPISAQDFTEAVNRSARACTDLAKNENNTDIPSCAEELLLVSGLIAFESLGCNLVIIEIAGVAHSATAALPKPLLNLVTEIHTQGAAENILPLLDNDNETVSALQTPDIAKLLSDRCFQIHSRLTMPLKNNFFIMEQTLGKTRFFYNKKEYFLASGAYYEGLSALTLLESYQAMARQGLKLLPEAPIAALAVVSPKEFFTPFSVSPAILLDGACTNHRLAALFDTLERQKEILGKQFAIWTRPEYESIISTAFAKQETLRLDSLLCIDDNNPYRQVKQAIKAYEKKLPLLILGDAKFIAYMDRTLKGGL